MLWILKLQKLIFGLLELLFFSFTVILPYLPFFECSRFRIFIDEHTFHVGHIVTSQHKWTQSFISSLLLVIICCQRHHPLPKYGNLGLISLALVDKGKNFFYFTMFKGCQLLALSRVANGSKAFTYLQMCLNRQLLLYIVSHLLTSNLWL